jgi:hypothetical protein
MGWMDRLCRWLRENPAESIPPSSYRTVQDDDEDEEITELIAIDII